ncbi:MAG: thermonuclease family protein [Candidatus Nanopelagicales bacterium]
MTEHRLVANVVTVLAVCALTSGCGRDVSIGTPRDDDRVGAPGHLSHGWRVSRVIDGDTLDVSRKGSTVRIRLIGVDAPETAHPSVPVECFGHEASTFARHALLHEHVSLEFDASQARTDRYGRSLAYVWIDSSSRFTLFNQRAIRLGYANEYTFRTEYRWRNQFLRAERRARAAEVGLWADC